MYVRAYQKISASGLSVRSYLQAGQCAGGGGVFVSVWVRDFVSAGGNHHEVLPRVRVFHGSSLPGGEVRGGKVVTKPKGATFVSILDAI